MAKAQNIFGVGQTFAITLTSLANQAGRIGSQVDFTDTDLKAPQAIMVFSHFKTGSSAPTAGKSIQFYWARGDEASPAHVDAGFGTSDASVTGYAATASRDQMQFVGAQVLTAIPDQNYYSSFIVYTPGPRGSLYVFNDSGQALSSTAGDFYVRYKTLDVDVY